MMMGTADEIVKAPEKGPVFMEDLPEEEQVVAVVRFLVMLFHTWVSMAFYHVWGTVMFSSYFCFLLQGSHCWSM